MHHPFANLIGLRFERLEDGMSECVLDIDEKHFNPNRVVHGAVLYAMADTGMGAALYPSLEPGQLCATIELKINYFKAVREGTVKCMTEVVNRGKTTANLDSSLYAEEVLVAKANGNYSIFRPKV